MLSSDSPTFLEAPSTSLYMAANTSHTYHYMKRKHMETEERSDYYNALPMAHALPWENVIQEYLGQTK